MRYILRKFIDADSVAEAIAKAELTPIHDVYLREGEEPKRGDLSSCHAIGFSSPPVSDSWSSGEIIGAAIDAARKKR